MKRLLKILMVCLVSLWVLPQAGAVDINLINIDMNSPENRQAAQLYGNSYGFTPEQVTPALLGPAEEVPSILRIAQAAGTVPLSVWMMRKMGMDYGRILQNFALAPATMLGSSPVPYVPGSYSPNWSRVLSPLLVQSSRAFFLRDILKVDPVFLPQIPWRGADFTRAILNPYHPGHGYWLPPGQAKKLGLWIPPGQAKKMGGYPYGYGKEKWEVKGDNGKYEAKWDEKNGQEKHGGKHEGEGNGHGHGKWK